MILQSTMYQKQNIDLSSAPWTMHEFFAGSGLVAYGLRGMFTPVWANDISEQKAAVYEANFGCERFILDDIKNVKGADLPFAHLSWASFPCQDLSLAGSIGGIHASRSGLVWEWLRVLDEMDDKPKILLLENVAGLLSTNGGDNYRVQMCIRDRQRALDQGCERVVVVLTRPREYRRKPDQMIRLIRKQYQEYPKFVQTMETRAQRYNENREQLFALEQEGKALVIAPKSTLGVGRIERDTEKLRLLWAEGYQMTVERMDEIRDYLGL